MTLISVFFFSPYHNLFPSGERFYLPAHFSNQISTWELDFFKSNSTSQLWFRWWQKKIASHALFSSRSLSNWEGSDKEQEGWIWVALLWSQLLCSPQSLNTCWLGSKTNELKPPPAPAILEGISKESKFLYSPGVMWILLSISISQYCVLATWHKMHAQLQTSGLPLPRGWRRFSQHVDEAVAVWSVLPISLLASCCLM